MSPFLESAKPESSKEADKNIMTSLPEHTACLCCLEQNVLFIDISTCKHIGFLNTFPDYKKLTGCLICYHCHNMLKKIEDFRLQVNQSIIILKTQAYYLETKVLNLEISPIENTTISPESTKNIIKLEQDDGHKPTHEVSVKVEFDTSNNMDCDVPLPEINEDSDDYRIVKEENLTPIEIEYVENTPLIVDQCIIKLEPLMLSKEELLKERESLRLDEKYLKFPFKCDTCIVVFNEEHDLKHHYNQKHDQSIGKYICRVCETVLISEKALLEHYSNHFVGYECNACSKRYTHEQSTKTADGDFEAHAEVVGLPEGAKTHGGGGAPLARVEERTSVGGAGGASSGSTIRVRSFAQWRAEPVSVPPSCSENESTTASNTEIQTITSRKKTNAQKCREYRERKKLQNTMVQNITAERSDECSETDQLQAKKKPKTNAERRKKHYEAQKLKKQQSKKIPKTVKQKNKEYYERKKKILALNTLNLYSDVSRDNCSAKICKHPEEIRNSAE